MNSKQEAKMGTNSATLKHLDDNRDIWLTSPAFNDAFASFKQKHEEAIKVVTEKARKLAGVFITKSNKKSSLTELALSMAGSLRAYASKINDDTLLAAMTFTRTELQSMRDNKLGPVCTHILNTLRLHITAMEAYDISSEMIDRFQNMIGEYTNASSSARTATSSRKSLGKSLAELLADIDVFVRDQLDPLMLRYLTTHPLFYDEYQNNRIIIDPKTSPTQFAGLITDEATGLPLNNVVVSIKDTAYVTNAKVDGNYKLRVPKNGSYTLLFEIAGYANVTVADVELKLGKSTEVNVKMRRIEDRG